MAQMIERRKQRSADTIVALHHQLAAVRAEACLDALVLADDAGCILAGAGAKPDCEELAAYSPFFLSGTSNCNSQVALETADLGGNIHFSPIQIDGMGVVLCAKGHPGKEPGKELDKQMSRAMSGCRRILAVGP